MNVTSKERLITLLKAARGYLLVAKVTPSLDSSRAYMRHANACLRMASDIKDRACEQTTSFNRRRVA